MIIRKQQLTVFGRAARETFERRLLEHIQEFFPVHWREVGRDGLHDVTRLGITNAASHGLETQREITLFVSLMLYFGSHFDTDDQLPWATQGLADVSDGDAFTRIEKTYHSALDYMGRVAGPNGQFAMSALRRFTMAAQARSRLALGDSLGSIYPEKYDVLDDGQRDRLAERAIECARTYRLDAGQGASLCAGLSLLLGHGFARDPQFPWIGHVLNDRQIPDAAGRLAALQEAVVLHLSRWFAAPEGTA